MSTNSTQKRSANLSVALLVSDISLAKSLSGILREFGIFAHYYQNLDEFWTGANTNTPDLTIIDLNNMNQGNLLLKNHPKVKTKQMRYAFAYSSQSRHLLSQLNGLHHKALINFEMDLHIQIKTLLENLGEESRLVETSKTLVERVQRLQKHSQHLASGAASGQSLEEGLLAAQALLSQFENFGPSESFAKRLGDVFCEWQECQSFGIYELSVNSEQLIGLRLERPHFKNLPDLWVNNTCTEGIDLSALDLIEEVCFDYFDKNLKLLKIEGAHNKPAMVVAGEFSSAPQILWDYIETGLSNIYRRQLLEKKESPKEDNLWSIWEVCSYLDDVHFHQMGQNLRALSVNMDVLVKTITSSADNRFFYKAFAQDFITKLSYLLHGESKVAYNGVSELIVFSELSSFDENLKLLQTFSAEFPYWRYFSDSSLIMSRDLTPKISLLPPSAVSLLTEKGQHVQKPQRLGARRRSNLSS